MAVQDGYILDFGTGLNITDYGLVQSYEIKEETKRAENKGPDGAILAIQDYGKFETLSLDYIPLLTPEETPPAIGTKFTFNGVKWSLELVENIRTVDGFSLISIKGKYYEQIGDSQ